MDKKIIENIKKHIEEKIIILTEKPSDNFDLRDAKIIESLLKNYTML